MGGNHLKVIKSSKGDHQLRAHIMHSCLSGRETGATSSVISILWVADFSYFPSWQTSCYGGTFCPSVKGERGREREREGVSEMLRQLASLHQGLIIIIPMQNGSEL